MNVQFSSEKRGNILEKEILDIIDLEKASPFIKDFSYIKLNSNGKIKLK